MEVSLLLFLARRVQLVWYENLERNKLWMLRCICVGDFKKFDLNVMNRFHTANVLLGCCDWD
jgi:hypothetical protein